jgi:hypothetical protein
LPGNLTSKGSFQVVIGESPLQEPKSVSRWCEVEVLSVGDTPLPSLRVLENYFTLLSTIVDSV